mmetsp:Transcript_50767/g.135400  ORF Transcript_50767/g.135400 Transcript_50767/m.135400 type:complete len:137 (-) Transcript_50767:292-702(-)
MGANCCAQEGQDESVNIATTPSTDEDQGPVTNDVVQVVYRDEGRPTTIEVKVVRDFPDEKLGMDVKHVHNQLKILKIFDVGAVARANRECLNHVPRKDTLQMGDIIVQVNDVQGSDIAMVSECWAKQELTFKVIRG